jgi:hypothetical protein
MTEDDPCFSATKSPITRGEYARICARRLKLRRPDLCSVFDERKLAAMMIGDDDPAEEIGSEEEEQQ